MYHMDKDANGKVVKLIQVHIAVILETSITKSRKRMNNYIKILRTNTATRCY